ncbi:MAG: methyltransferase domain-containing protein [Gammaproteobacteria bacterium]|nr:methyltransferase domain-containing protein [Gammaproteobacteria bacterium]
MFEIDFLHQIRDHELAVVRTQLPASASILELGGGTGYQARVLDNWGYAIESIDVEESNYRNDRLYDVHTYDGSHLPYPAASFDVIFSSNVLEHVKDLERLDREIRRVLRPGGICVHVMPSASWRWWTIIAHYIEMVQKAARLVYRPAAQREQADAAPVAPMRRARTIAGLLLHYIKVPRHGEQGNAFTELYTFSRRAWLKRLRALGYDRIRIEPVGLYYSGHMILGSLLPLRWRKSMAWLLGSSAIVYTLKP